jgi:hypothetical protein
MRGPQEGPTTDYVIVIMSHDTPPSLCYTMRTISSSHYNTVFRTNSSAASSRIRHLVKVHIYLRSASSWMVGRMSCLMLAVISTAISIASSSFREITFYKFADLSSCPTSGAFLTSQPHNRLYQSTPKATRINITSCLTSPPQVGHCQCHRIVFSGLAICDTLPLET